MEPAAPLLWAVFILLAKPQMMAAVLLSALPHELGHYFVLRHYGGTVSELRLTALGAETPHNGGELDHALLIGTTDRQPFSYEVGDEVMTVQVVRKSMAAIVRSQQQVTVRVPSGTTILSVFGTIVPSSPGK